MSGIGEIAYKKVTDDPETQLKIWWAQTYKRPILHSNLEDYNYEELLMEFYLMKFASDEEFKRDWEKRNGIANIDQEYEDWLKRKMGDKYVAPAEESNEDDLEIHEKF